jgi:hypothetical protein
VINLFCGHDPREAVGFHVFTHSVIARATQPVNLVPLASMGLPHGSNSFTLSRFLVPYLMGFKGHAIFADACDMLMLGDVAELDVLFDPRYAVQVVKHPTYESQHVRKYVGTEMECEQSNYPRKNWASLAIFNCAHSAWFGATPKWAALSSSLDLLQFNHLNPGEIGSLPAEWNVLVDEGQERSGAKLLHWSAGIPTFRHYRNARASADWFAEFESLNRASQ